MKELIAKLDILRIIRIVSGIFFGIYGLVTYQYLISLLGGLVLLQGILNVGCCAGGCNVPSKTISNKDKDITYEEVSR